MKYIFIPTLLTMFIANPALAKEQACSIHPAKGTPDSDLTSLAKISQEDAQKIALEDVKASDKKTLDGELEAEDNCLVYSFDIRITNKAGLEEIMVDAGTGKILSHKHETPKQEAAEKAQDAKSSMGNK